jgi:hypothetical protein
MSLQKKNVYRHYCCFFSSALYFCIAYIQTALYTYKQLCIHTISFVYIQTALYTFKQLCIHTNSFVFVYIQTALYTYKALQSWLHVTTVKSENDRFFFSSPYLSIKKKKKNWTKQAALFILSTISSITWERNKACCLLTSLTQFKFVVTAVYWK